MWVSFYFLAAFWFFLSGDDWTGSLVQEVEIFFSKDLKQWKNHYKHDKVSVSHFCPNTGQSELQHPAQGHTLKGQCCPF